MKEIKFSQYIIPFYLLILLLIQIDFTITNLLFVIIPIVLILAAIYLKDKKIGILSLFLFFTFSISTILIKDIEDYFRISLLSLLIILPSILLISYILQLDSKKKVMFESINRRGFFSILLYASVIILFYSILISLWDGYLLTTNSISPSILVFAAISLIFCLPFILNTKIKKKII